jgi:hypothetical protein
MRLQFEVQKFFTEDKPLRRCHHFVSGGMFPAREGKWCRRRHRYYIQRTLQTHLSFASMPTLQHSRNFAIDNVECCSVVALPS